ncbi:Hypothetical predicted protein, partial [Mytilus galloprovincialis]
MLHIVIIVTLLSVGHAKSSYLILAPKQVQPGVNFEISVTVLNASSNVTVKAKLVTTINSSFISQTSGTFNRESTNQISLHVPDSLEQACKLIITGTGGLSFTEETYISYRARTVSLFIQTDKGIYKAGQTINFRVFALYTDLQMYYGPFDIYMHDPKGNLIKQWRHVSHDSGVYSGSMAMTDNPVLGDWTIKATSHGVSSNRTVTVDQYVLPKFEVTVHLPSYVLTNASQVQGIVEAKYSYGKPVSGNVEIEANLYWACNSWNDQRYIPIIRLHNITMESDGKARFVIPIATLRARLLLPVGDQYMVVKANVTETLTDITLSGSEEVTFSDQSKKILFLPATKTTFKPGLPYKVHAQLTEIDGTPITTYAQGILKITVFSNETILSPLPQLFYGPIKHIRLNVSTAGIISELIDIPDNALKILIQVSIRFNQSKAKPGDNVTISVAADPTSYIYMLVADESSSHLREGNDITEEQIKPLPYSQTGRIMDFFITRIKGGGTMTGTGTGTSTGGTMTGTGTGTSTGGSFTGNTHPFYKPVKRTRKRFPETWMWSSHLTGIDGHLNITAVLPDTITAWVASAFVVNKRSGFSLSTSAAKIVGFKDFFVSLSMPYSVIRGEEVALQVNLFNYQNKNMSVLIILKNNDDFQNVVRTVNGTQQLMFSKTQSENTFVLAGESTTVYFPIVPRSLGPIYIEVTAQSSVASDGVRRELLVEPEGVLQEYNTPVILQVNHSHPVQRNVSVPLPLSVVNGSQKIRVSIMGDLVGPTLHNLDQLIRLPTGCGEQTIVKLAPDVYVANYLKKSNQYSQDMKEKLTVYMEKGYQNELRYQRTDGSFSAFGNSDSYGNM